jgi:hypothetical protein
MLQDVAEIAAADPRCRAVEQTVAAMLSGKTILPSPCYDTLQREVAMIWLLGALAVLVLAFWTIFPKPRWRRRDAGSFSETSGVNYAGQGPIDADGPGTHHDGSGTHHGSHDSGGHGGGGDGGAGH